MRKKKWTERRQVKRQQRRTPTVFLLAVLGSKRAASRVILSVLPLLSWTFAHLKLHFSQQNCSTAAGHFTAGTGLSLRGAAAGAGGTSAAVPKERSLQNICSKKHQSKLCTRWINGLSLGTYNAWHATKWRITDTFIQISCLPPVATQ